MFLYQVVPSLPLLRQVFFIYEKFDLHRSLVIFTIGHRNPSLLLWNISNQKGQLFDMQLCMFLQNHVWNTLVNSCS